MGLINKLKTFFLSFCFLSTQVFAQPSDEDIVRMKIMTISTAMSYEALHLACEEANNKVTNINCERVNWRRNIIINLWSQISDDNYEEIVSKGIHRALVEDKVINP